MVHSYTLFTWLFPTPSRRAGTTFILSLPGVASIAWMTLRRRKTPAAKTC